MSEIKQGYKQTKLGIIPEDWEVVKFDELKDKTDRHSITGGPFGSDLKSEHYTSSGVRVIQLQNIGDGKYINKEFVYTSEEKANQLKNCLIYPNEIILAKMAEPVARACLIPSFEDKFLMCSDGIRLLVDKNKFSTKYVLEYINYDLFRKIAINRSTGSTRGRIGLTDLKTIPLALPPLKEQEKIAQILTTWDEAITKQTELLRAKELQKKALMQKLLSGEVRFDGFSDEWHFYKLGDLLDYEQPTNYLVNDTNYDDSFNTPVLTAGKTFILGYTNETDGIYKEQLPVIIFDDFTTATQFVDFPFKAKSSAMKILKSKGNLGNIKVIFELMQTIKYQADDHKRYWISEYQDLEIKLPSFQEQQKIAEVLSLADDEINLLKNSLVELNLQKKALMQKLLTGEVRVKV
jgi:type I restriction enzyme S subunit